jgi:DNA-binding transcriptional regulator YiaG
MKDKITQAGFKSQADLARHLGKTKATVHKWSRKHEEAPKWFLEYLTTRKENIALREALRTFKQYCNQ